MKNKTHILALLPCLFLLLSISACDLINSFSSNMPEGAIEYIEGQDGSITLYEDRLEVEGSEIQGGSITIDIDKIGMIKKYGHYMRISTTDGTDLQLSMFSARQMTKLKEAINELR